MRATELSSRLVVKFGTESLSLDGKLNQPIFDGFAREIMQVNQLGVEVAIVSSGAIRAGKEEMSALGLETKHLEKKLIAGIGARHLMTRWGKAFENYKREVAQIWVTYASLANSGEKESTKSGILCYLKHGIIPIINENDILSDEEIRWMEQGISENDNLARQIAFLVDADAVLFITNVKGVYREDAQENSEAEIYTKLWCDNMLEDVGSGSSSEGGTGGIGTKLNAATECAKAGKRVCIVGQTEDMIIKFIKGISIGTTVVDRFLERR